MNLWFHWNSFSKATTDLSPIGYNCGRDGTNKELLLSYFSSKLPLFSPKRMRIQDRWCCSDGKNPHWSLTKSSSALRLGMPGMLGKSTYYENKLVALSTFEFFNKNPSHSLSRSPFKNVLRPPLGQCLKESYFYFGWLPWIESCWGQGSLWTKRESDGLGLIIPLTERTDDLVTYCWAHYGGHCW